MRYVLGFLVAGMTSGPMQLLAVPIEKSFETRISSACVKSVEEQGGKVPNYKTVCKCIAETHYKSAVSEETSAEARDHIQWTTEFYEATDKKKLQRMVDKNPKWSSFDDQVVEDCMESSTRKIGK